MTADINLQRFIDAQQISYRTALSEIASGRKRSHWIWYVFPQMAGLGRSDMAEFYGIRSRAEAEAYLAHPVLGERLIEICNALLRHEGTPPQAIFGSPDDLKLRSSMTLFASLAGAPPVFQHVLNQFYGGKKDEKTLQLLR